MAEEVTWAKRYYTTAARLAVLAVSETDGLVREQLESAAAALCRAGLEHETNKRAREERLEAEARAMRSADSDWSYW